MAEFTFITFQDRHQLIVIDPEDREQVQRLIDADEDAIRNHRDLGRVERVQAGLRSLLPTKSVVEEPGLWGIVEASCVHSRVRRTWVRGHHGWNDTDGDSEPDDWGSLIGAVVVREGVQS